MKYFMGNRLEMKAESLLICLWHCRNDPMFLDRQVWANILNPDQTAGAVWSGSTLFAIPSAAFGPITL